jgi:hypothetical protein
VVTPPTTPLTPYLPPSKTEVVIGGGKQTAIPSKPKVVSVVIGGGGSGGGGTSPTSSNTPKIIPLPEPPTPQKIITAPTQTQAKSNLIKNANLQQNNILLSKLKKQSSSAKAVLYEKQVDSFRPEGKTKDIPVTKVYYKQGTTERPATNEEQQYYKTQTNVVQASTKKVNVPYQKIKEKVTKTTGTINEGLYTGITKRIENTGKKAYNKIPVGVRERISLSDSKLSNNIAGNTVRFSKGVVGGIYTDVRDQPLKNVALIGGGAIVGGTIRGISYGAKAVSKAPYIKPIAKSLSTKVRTIKIVGGTGLLTYYGSGITSQVISAPTYQEKGKVIGIAGKDVALFGYGATKGTKAGDFLFRPIRVREPIRPVKVPEAKEVSFDVITGGKEYTLSKYVIEGEVRPPIRKYTTTRFKQYFDIQPKPKNVKTIPARTYRVETLSPVVNNKPFAVSEIRQGSKVGRLSYIQGKTESFNPKIELDSLTNTERYTLNKMIESRTGLPASEKTSKIFFKEGADLTKSFIKSEKLSKINVKDRKVNILTMGKRVNLNQAITRTNVLRDTDDYTLYRSSTFFKDVTKPFSRSSGKIPELRTTILRIKEPLVLDTDSPTIIKTTGTTKTPLSVTFGKGLKTTTLQTYKEMPKVLPKVTTTKTTMTTTSNSLYPKSKFYGLGAYERTESIGYVSPSNINPSSVRVTGYSINPPRDSSLINNRQASFPKIDYTNKNIVQPNIKTGTTTKQDNVLKEITKEKVQEKTMNKYNLDTRTLPQLKEITKQKEIQKTKEITKLKEVPKLKTPPTTIPRTPRVPYIKTPPARMLLPRFNKVSYTPKSTGRYTVSVRRFGKFKPIGIFSSYKQAFNVGKGKVSRTLGATFKVSGGGNYSTPSGFYSRNTKEGRLFIEQPKYRLSTGSEKLEIKSFKKSRSRLW